MSAGLDLGRAVRVWMDMGIVAIDSAGGNAEDGARQLTRAIARGDSTAFELLYDAWFDRALALARRLTSRDEAFCLDVVQEAMIRAARKIPELGSAERVDAWMGRVVHRAALDLLRAERRRGQRERAALRAGPAGGEAELRERIEWVMGELSALDGRERGALASRFWRGRAVRDVGEDLGMSSGGGHGVLRRTIDRLRARAREEFGDE